MSNKKLVVAGKIIKGKKVLKVDPDFLKKQVLKRTAPRSEVEVISPKPPGQARLDMTGI